MSNKLMEILIYQSNCKYASGVHLQKLGSYGNHYLYIIVYNIIKIYKIWTLNIVSNISVEVMS